MTLTWFKNRGLWEEFPGKWLKGADSVELCLLPFPFFFFLKDYLFIYFWLHQVFVAACRIFCCGARALPCSMQTSL